MFKLDLAEKRLLLGVPPGPKTRPPGARDPERGPSFDPPGTQRKRDSPASHRKGPQEKEENMEHDQELISALTLSAY